MNAYEDYVAWKKNNIETINYLVENHSNIIARFRYVIAVTDFLADKALIQKKDLSLDEEEIFETGYSYIFDRFNTITLLCQKNFNNDLAEMDKLSKSINLLLYIQDFEDELDSQPVDHPNEMKEFRNIEQEVLSCIEDKVDAPDGLFALLDDVSMRVFDTLGIEYTGITDIFYDLAIEFGMVKEDDDIYLDVLDFVNNNNTI